MNGDSVLGIFLLPDVFGLAGSWPATTGRTERRVETAEWVELVECGTKIKVIPAYLYPRAYPSHRNKGQRRARGFDTGVRFSFKFILLDSPAVDYVPSIIEKVFGSEPEHRFVLVGTPRSIPQSLMQSLGGISLSRYRWIGGCWGRAGCGWLVCLRPPIGSAEINELAAVFFRNFGKELTDANGGRLYHARRKSGFTY